MVVMTLKCIEVAHIYGNEKWGEEQETSFNLGLKLKKELGNARLTILVDDYHSQPIKELPVNLLLADKICYEGSFIGEAEKIFKEINPSNITVHYFRKENKSVFFYKHGKQLIPLYSEIENKRTYTCVALSFSWHCARSGAVSSSQVEPADQLISILPVKYKAVEEQVHILLQALRPAVKIEWVWF